jgi:hypothetical protein
MYGNGSSGLFACARKTVLSSSIILFHDHLRKKVVHHRQENTGNKKTNPGNAVGDSREQSYLTFCVSDSWMLASKTKN